MKRILVISDSHGRNDDIEGVLRQVGHIDYLIHCGDLERGDAYMLLDLDAKPSEDRKSVV